MAAPRLHLNANKIAILRYLLGHPKPASYKDIEQGAQVSYDAVATNLRALELHGWVEKSDPSRPRRKGLSHRYVVSEHARPYIKNVLPDD
jgi:DNA-binding MarR family transcriptional regulator